MGNIWGKQISLQLSQKGIPQNLTVYKCNDGLADTWILIHKIYNWVVTWKIFSLNVRTLQRRLGLLKQGATIQHYSTLALLFIYSVENHVNINDWSVMILYSKVRIWNGYGLPEGHYWCIDAFAALYISSQLINAPYVDGISITYGTQENMYGPMQ